MSIAIERKKKRITPALFATLREKDKKRLEKRTRASKKSKELCLVVFLMRSFLRKERLISLDISVVRYRVTRDKRPSRHNLITSAKCRLTAARPQIWNPFLFHRFGQSKTRNEISGAKFRVYAQWRERGNYRSAKSTPSNKCVTWVGNERRITQPWIASLFSGLIWKKREKPFVLCT